VCGVDVGDGGGFAESVAFANDRAGGLLKFIEVIDGHGGGTGDAVFDGRDIVFSDVLLMQEGGVDRGCAGKDGGAVFVDGLQHVFGHVACEGDEFGGEQGVEIQADGQAIDMKERHDAQEAFLFLFAQLAKHLAALLRVNDQVGVGQHTAFGQPGGAAGILQDGHVLLGTNGVAGVVATPLDEVAPGHDRAAVEGHLDALISVFQGVEGVEREGEAVGDGGYDGALDGRLREEVFDLGPEEVEGDEEFRTAVVELVHDLGFHIERIGHDQGGARAQGGPVGHDRLRQIRKHDGDAVAPVHAQVVQAGGDSARAGGQIAIGDHPILEMHGDAVRVFFRRLIQQGMQGGEEGLEVGHDLIVILIHPGARYVGHVYPHLSLVNGNEFSLRTR